MGPGRSTADRSPNGVLAWRTGHLHMTGSPAPSHAAKAATALVTGGAGFIGSTLVDRLLGEGWRVTALDSFDSFYSADRKHRHLAGASQQRAFRLVDGDIRDPDAVADAFRDPLPDVVFHLAAKAGVRPSIQDALGYIDTNVAGLQNVIRATESAQARLVFASSSSVYGDDPRQPFTEDQARLQPMSPYGATKTAGEALVNAHHSVTGLPVGIARLFTVYGPRQRPDLAIHTFAMQILAGEPLHLFDRGNGVRDYTYVADAVDALLRLAEGPPSLTVNVGSHRPIRTADVVTLLEQALAITAERVLLPPQSGDVPATFADVSRAREVLGWQPGVPLDVGVARFCEWLVADLEASRTAAPRRGGRGG